MHAVIIVDAVCTSTVGMNEMAHIRQLKLLNRVPAIVQNRYAINMHVVILVDSVCTNGPTL